jgi:hypothetical protein
MKEISKIKGKITLRKNAKKILKLAPIAAEKYILFVTIFPHLLKQIYRSLICRLFLTCRCIF